MNEKEPDYSAMDISNSTTRLVWKCCCGTFSDEQVKYLVQIGFGASLLLFSMVQIIRKDGDVTVYYSMLSGIIGLFLPSPGMKK